jgi:putative ATP-dependent endonuclease of OLD family
MYLEKFNIKNFRSIKDISLSFNKGLNVLIGENNSGKTAILDALRLGLGHGNQRRELFVSLADFYIQRDAILNTMNDIEFHLHFKIETPEEAGWFNDLLFVADNGDQELQLHLRYYIDESSKVKRVKYKIWGGANEGQLISSEVLLLLYHVHLDALRDAEQYLRPIRGNKLGQLYANIPIDPDGTIDAEKKREIAKKVRTAVDADEEWTTHLNNGKTRINEHLKETSFIYKQQLIEVDFLPFDFHKLVDNLKIHLPIYAEELLEGDTSKQRHFDLFQNGLGYNNLIYTATILGDLKQQKELEKESYVALLIEEPEAHLHPHLQNLFFSYLNKLDQEFGFQIFISSHSPTITAKADLKSIIVLQNQVHTISGLSLIKSGLSEDNRKYLHKFLDVTKSQIFFSNGSILVEGISEALLFPIFSKKLGDDYNIERSGIELVNLNGVAFSHFANLYNNDEDAKNLKTRCSLVTDDDSTSETDEVASRAKIAASLENKNLKVFLAERTFEFELFIAGNNKDTLMEIFTEMHPVAAGRIVADADVKVHGANFLAKVVSNKAKSELAHRLALKLAADMELLASFTIPDYIIKAIKYAVKGE